ncbi:MAG: deoxyribodipyrimidine photo-lyase, partial [Actinomycetota bacterium]
MSRAIVWFRRDLTLADNPAWAAATSEHDEVVPVYVLETGLRASGAEYRQRFHLAALAGLADEVQALGGALHLVTGDARREIPRLASEFGARTVTWNDDVTARAVTRDGRVADALSAAGIRSDRYWGTLVARPGSIRTNAGAIPRVFTRFHEKWAEVPDPGAVVAGAATVLTLPGEALPVLDAAPPIPGGSIGARARLDALQDRVDRYVDERDRPDLDTTSHLSADLRFGTISPREMIRAIGRATKGRAAIVRQLAWRDWYAHLFWERPDLVDHCQQPAYELIEWRDDPEGFDAWRAGRTGYPIVDAGMRELATTGWMHNRVNTRGMAPAFVRIEPGRATSVPQYRSLRIPAAESASATRPSRV